MQFAVNYSETARELYLQGQIQVDYFKCPAWPELVRRARVAGRVYVHFPLRVGRGIGNAMDTEMGRPADWRKVEALLTQTGTQQVNLHLAPLVGEHDGIPLEGSDASHVDVVTEAMIRDVQAVVKRFGTEKVVLENADDGRSGILRVALLPGVINRVVKETGCGFLLDISHARLAAWRLGMDAREYLAELPSERIQEIHLAGIQRFLGCWVTRAQAAGIDARVIQQMNGRLVDHLPLADGDWDFCEWAMQEVRRGAWREPWVVALEYGGVGGLWEMTADRDHLAEQVPRLCGIVKDGRLAQSTEVGLDQQTEAIG
jgi:uncharacterized protein (UPF0276 family)